MSETWFQHKNLLEEEIRDLSSYLAGIPPSLRASGAFAAHESRITLLQQQLSGLQQLHQVQRTAAGQPPQLFLNYASADRDLVSGLYQRLSVAGFKPLVDQRDIVPGNRWSPTLDRMIRGAHFFLACLSRHSITKSGFVERERDMALVIQALLPSHVPYLIPVQLEPCDVPPELCTFQAIQLFEDDGFRRLCAAIETGMKQRFPRPGAPKQSADAPSIVIQGALVWSLFPAAGAVRVSACLCPEAPVTLVHPKKFAELEKRFSKPLPYSGGGRYYRYDLSFMFPGGDLFSAGDGFAVPEDWPFADEDLRLGSDITEQFSLTFTYSGSLTVKRRRR